MSKLIRNSTAEFLIFTTQNRENSIEVQYKNNTIWLSQKLMARLFEVDVSTINEHLKNIYNSDELDKNTTIGNFPIVQKEGNRTLKRTIVFYNLDAIISVGYRVNSVRATQFRQWATKILSEFSIKGFVVDKARLENGNYLNENYFEELLSEIREIRLSERKFYQKITDIYATSLDYDKNTKATKLFFAKVQNKMHYGIHRHTAAELIHKRVDSKKDKMGLTNWKNSPDGKILKTDIVIAKNYLNKDEIESLGRIVNAFLDLAESRAKRKTPMTMQDWEKRLDLFLEYDERAVLQDVGKITLKIAKDKAKSEFEKYRLIQDKAFISDFDKLMIEHLGDKG